jgi:itaconate CoA-transferase
MPSPPSEDDVAVHGGDAAPLGGVVVVSLEHAIAAPFASRQLADLGATVVKIERPGGDFARRYDSHVGGTSAFFVWANRGKHSVVLDLKEPVDAARMAALVAGADVFLHNLSPGAVGRLSLDGATLRRRHPQLVVCEISGYGPGGPRSDDRAYDLAIQAEAGVFAVNGTEDQLSKAGFSVADIAAATSALTGILAALVRRERTGSGALVQVSMLEALTEWMSAPIYHAVHGPGRPPRTGRRHHAIAPYGTYALRDGGVVLIAVQHDDEWQRLTREVLGRDDLADRPDWRTNAGRIADVDRLEVALGDALADLDPTDARQRLASAGIAVARVNDLKEVWRHEQLRARDRFTTVGTPGGPLELLRPPIDVDGWAPRGGRVPQIGEHDPSVIESITQRGRARRAGTGESAGHP